MFPDSALAELNGLIAYSRGYWQGDRTYLFPLGHSTYPEVDAERYINPVN